LFKSAIQPGHCIGNPVAAFVATPNFGALRHAFDLTRELVKPIVHHCEIVGEHVLVVALMITIWSASVPHAFLRLLVLERRNLRGPWSRRLLMEGADWRGPKSVRRPFFIMVNKRLTRWASRRISLNWARRTAYRVSWMAA
jgi:hypothetical protein